MPHSSSIAELVCPFAVDLGGNPFAELAASVQFEDVGKGRRGAVLFRGDDAGGVPLVRSTTRSAAPAQRFRPVHERLAAAIQTVAALPLGFNNALIEIYTNAYTTMSGHSDLALDLADGSFIALFSCYERPDRANPPRTLFVESKGPGGERVGIPLTHGGAVVFSVAANRRLRHRIVLDTAARAAENRWLGVTFRTSKTVVRYRDGRAHLPDGAVLTLADEEQRRDFFHLRRRENDETDFAYPLIAFTVSAGDLLPPADGG